MERPHDTTPTTDPDVRWLEQQHQHDLEALDIAADIIAALLTRLAVSQAGGSTTNP